MNKSDRCWQYQIRISERAKKGNLWFIEVVLNSTKQIKKYFQQLHQAKQKLNDEVKNFVLIYPPNFFYHLMSRFLSCSNLTLALAVILDWSDLGGNIPISKPLPTQWYLELRKAIVFFRISTSCQKNEIKISD